MRVILSVCALAFVVVGKVAHADFDITIQQVGSDVVMTGSGDLQGGSSIKIGLVGMPQAMSTKVNYVLAMTRREQV